jgi:predicted deacylase
MNEQSANSRIKFSVDLELPGRQVGDLHLKWSDNRQPLGCYPVPIICLSNGEGPTVLLTGGVHGDEFEGPAALMRLAQNLSLERLQGRVIILPALNASAVLASSRVSPLDQVNMNRAFPGDPDGGPTRMLAHFVETVLLPQCDAAIDLHSGGKATRFAACALAQANSGSATDEANLALANAFGAPYIWLAGRQNDDRSLNAAAQRQGVAMIAVELGGGGGCDPAMTGLAESGVMRCLSHLGMTTDPVEASPVNPVMLEFVAPQQNYMSPAAGLFDRGFNIGDEVEAGETAGWLHFVNEPERPSTRLEFPCAGVIMAHADRGIVERGETLALIGRKCNLGEDGS